MRGHIIRQSKVIGILMATVIVLNCDAGAFVEPVSTGTGEAATLQLEGLVATVTEQDTVHLRAVLLDEDGQVIPDPLLVWTSSDPDVLTVRATAPGEALLIAHEPGMATVSVSYGELSAEARVEVHNRPVDLMYVAGSEQNGAPGTLLRDSLVVRAIDRRGDPVADVSVDFLVTAGGGAVAPATSVTDAWGRARTAWTLGNVGGQSVRALASSGQPRVKQMKDSVVVFVATAVGPVASLDVTPDSATVQEGETIQLSVTAHDSDGSPVTDADVQWASTDTAVATISSSGLLRGRRKGKARAVASAASATGTVADSAEVSVNEVALTLSGIEVRPTSATVDTGATLQFDAIGLMDDGSEAPVGVSWSATGGTIDANGRYTAGTHVGTFRVVASHNQGFSDTSTVSVVAATAPVAAVIVSPTADTLDALGATTQLDARAVDAEGGVVQHVVFQWTSSDADVATVDAGGKVTAKAVGTVLIVAAAAGFADTADIVVRQVPVALAIQPANVSVAVGGTQQMAATLSDARGNPIPDPAFSWSAADPAIARVDAHGLVTGVAEGSTRITASSGGVDGQAAVTVRAVDGDVTGAWLSPAELAALPTSGAAWDNVKRAADGNLSGGVLTTRDDHNARVLAAALVAARLDDDGYRAKVRDALVDLMGAPYGTDDGLARNRRLGTYAIAADLIGLGSFDPTTDAAFRAWLIGARDTNFSSGGGGTLAGYHERRPNNYGTHAGFSRMAVALYLGDQADFERAVLVFRGWLGDRSAYADFQFRDDFTWHADPDRPVAINPKGATKRDDSGVVRSIDGVLTDDQRRCGSFQWPPCLTGYTWEGLQGAIGMAWIAHRQGYDAFNWSDQALLRAVEWLYTQADYPAEGDDLWQVHLVNSVYGTDFPAPLGVSPGKNLGWTDWTHR